MSVSLILSKPATSSKIKNFLVKSAIVGPAILSFIRYGCGDCSVQMAEQNKKYDYRRTLKYALFGGLYSGLISGPLVTRVYPRIIPRLGRFGGVKAALFECIIMCPFAYFPVFYFVKYSLEEGGTPKLAMHEYRQNIVGDAARMWAFWIPVHSLSFSLVLPAYRQYVAVTVGFLWSMILSHMKK